MDSVGSGLTSLLASQSAVFGYFECSTMFTSFEDCHTQNERHPFYSWIDYNLKFDSPD
jgi:hypothetical protein